MPKIASSDGGWVEILYRTTPFPRIQSWKEIGRSDYALVGRPINARELENLFQAYMLLHDSPQPEQPRPPREGDILNLRHLDTNRVQSYMLVAAANAEELSDRIPFTEIETLPKYPLGLVKMPDTLGTFWKPPFDYYT